MCMYVYSIRIIKRFYVPIIFSGVTQDSTIRGVFPVTIKLMYCIQRVLFWEGNPTSTETPSVYPRNFLMGLLYFEFWITI
jgi:hypothetical protein